MNVDELATFLAEHGYRFEYDHEARDPLQTTLWCRWWVARAESGEAVAWGRDPDEETMIAHILTMPQLHDDLPMGERFRNFGIELGDFGTGTGTAGEE